MNYAVSALHVSNNFVINMNYRNMNYRKLGKTNIFVSEIGLGTAQIGGLSLTAGKYVGYQQIEKPDAFRILNKAYDNGINFFDSSDKYGDGKSERLLGEVFNNKRDKVIFATKCGITATGERCFKKGYVKSKLEQSLKNLKTDYIDIYQLNKPSMSLIESGEIYELLDDFKKEGKIRFSGISTGTDEENVKLISDNKVDTLQIFYNLLHIYPNKLFISKAFDNGIGLIIKSPLSSGMLTGKYTYRTRFDREDYRSHFLSGQTLFSRVDKVNKIIDHFRLSSKYNILHLSLNYLLSNNKIASIIPGISKARQLDDILKLCYFERISPHDVYILEKFIQESLNY